MRPCMVAFVLACSCLLTACPEKVDEVGGAPKRQIDHVEDRMDEATKNVNERLERAAERAEE